MRLVFLSEVCEQIRGVSYKSGDAKKNLHSQHTKLYRANNISSGSIIEDDLVYVPDNRVQSRQLLKKGDIVVAASSGSINVVGKAAMVRDTTRATFGAFLKVLRPNVELIDIDYFGHFFQSQRYLQYIRSVAVGANINNLTNSHFDNIKIPLPPLEEQKRIAEILDQARKPKVLVDKQIDKLRLLKQAYFYEVCGNPFTASFKRRKLLDVIELNPSKREVNKLEERLPVSFIGMEDISESGGLLNKKTGYLNDYLSGYTFFKNNDVLFAKITPCMENGKGALVTELTNGIGFGSTEFFVLRAKEEKSHPIWIRELVQLPMFRKIAESYMRGSAGHKRVPPTFFKELKVVIPDYTVQQKFAEVIEKIDRLIVAKMTTKDKNYNLYQSLLQRAFKGELSKQPVG